MQTPVVVGVDSSDAHHDVCILGPDGEPEPRLRIANDLSGFRHLLDEIERRWPDHPCRFGLENPCSLLGRFLPLAGKTVYPINPRAVVRTREGLASSGKKSDVLDARTIALILRERGDELQPVCVNSPEGSLVIGLVEQRRDLVREKTRLQNQLTAALKRFYPRALELFPELDQPITHAFLQAFPGPSALEEATLDQWQALFAGTRYPRPKRIASLWERAKQPQVPVDRVQEQLARRQVQSLLRLFLVLLDELAQVEAAIDEEFARHPDADLFRSLPGAARVLAPSLLALLGDNRERWREVRQLTTYSGAAPITRSSGKRRTVQMRHHCDREARSVLHLFANCSRRQCAWAQAFYERQRAAGKTHAAALRSLAIKWLRIIFRMWHERQPYDEAAYLRAIQHKQRGNISGQTAAVAA